MKNYSAEITTGIVRQIIVGDYVWANENLAGEWVDCTDDGNLTIAVGYTYDAELDAFIAPVVEEI
jgi:hypothetical protein